MEALLLLPSWYLATLVVFLGLIIGSFLNVVIYRLHTGRSLQGSSHCLSCGTPLRWYELFPVLSYLALRGRCRTCFSYIPLRYVLVELGAAALFYLAYLVVPLSPLLLVWFLLLSLLLVITAYDLYHLIIPDELVVGVGTVSLVLFALTPGAWGDWQLWLTHALAALGAFSFFGGLWYVSRGRWIGFGDAKLAIPLAFVLGPYATFTFVVLSFWVGAAVSVVLLIVQALLKRGQHRLSKYGVTITMRSEVPFAPFIVISFLLTALLGADALLLIDAVL